MARYGFRKQIQSVLHKIGNLMNGFYFYDDYLPLLNKLSDAARGRLIKAVLEYSATKVRMDFSTVANDREKETFGRLYNLMADDIDRGTRRKYEVSEARRKAGLASGRARQAKKGGCDGKE